MEVGRARYDNKVKAKEVQVGDQLHLTFMGGDDYVEVYFVEHHLDTHEVTWKAHSYSDLSDTVHEDMEMWVKK